MLGAIPWGLLFLSPAPRPPDRVLNSQKPLGLDLVRLFLSSSKWAKMLMTVGAAGPALPGCQGPLPAGGGGQARAGGMEAERPSLAPARSFSPAGSVGAAWALGPGLALPRMPGSSTLSLSFLPGSADGQRW